MRGPVIDQILIIDPKAHAVIADGMDCIGIVAQSLKLPAPAHHEIIHRYARSRAAGAEIEVNGGINATHRRAPGKPIGEGVTAEVVAAQASAVADGSADRHNIEGHRRTVNRAVAVKHIYVVYAGIGDLGVDDRHARRGFAGHKVSIEAPLIVKRIACRRVPIRSNRESGCITDLDDSVHWLIGDGGAWVDHIEINRAIIRAGAVVYANTINTIM